MDTKSLSIEILRAVMYFLEIINNLSSFKKGNHERGVWMSHLISINFTIFLSPFLSQDRV